MCEIGEAVGIAVWRWALVAEGVEEFAAEGGVGGEEAVVVDGDGGGELLFYAAHLHAEVLGAAFHYYAVGGEGAAEGFADFGGEALLHLEAARHGVDQAGEFAEAYHVAVGDVAYAYGAEEGEDVVLAHGVDFDVAHHYHARPGVVEYGLFEDFFGALAVALSDEPHCFCGAHGGFEKTFACGVLSYQFQYLSIVTGYGFNAFLLLGGAGLYGEIRCVATHEYKVGGGGEIQNYEL